MLPLKEATATRHKEAERKPFNVRMFRGEMSKNDYLLYLVQQKSIFQAIEHVGVPDENLSRTQNVQADVDELNREGFTDNRILESTRTYSDYLTSLSPEQILPHVYLNYMAIMFGGQMMKKVVPSSGKMYDFENMQDAIQSIRKIQKDEWADEVNKGFDYIISIFDELETVSVKS